MQGSSKSLALALSTVYDSWENNFDWINSPSADVKDVFLIIDAYIKKHVTASATLNESLKAIHDSHVLNSESISREIFFLEVLTRLVPVLNNDHIKQCLQTYLRPALDSGGYDLAFVEKARQFFKKVVLESSDLKEYPPSSRVEANSSLVIDSILKVFIMGASGSSTLLGFEAVIADTCPSINTERAQYADQNASDLLKDMVLKNPTQYFNLLDKYFRIPTKRQKACLLLCQTLSTNSPHINSITSTPLFATLIRSISFDYNLSIISGALLALLMIIGKISDTLFNYLPELFYIFGRLATLKRYSKFINNRETAMVQSLANLNIEWSVAHYDTSSPPFKAFLKRDGNFDTLYLLSVLYGLFPLHVLDFAKLPIKYFQNSNPSILPLQFLTQVEDTFLLPIYTYIGECAQTLLKRVIMHPNIINRLTLEEELRDPTRWILVENNGKEVSDEVILLTCLRLNPDIFPSLSNHWALSSIANDRELLNSEFERAFFPVPKDRRLVGSSLPSARHSVGLSQSDGEKAAQGFRLELPLPFSPKLPSVLFIDNHTAHAGGDGSIQFKNFDFAGRASIGLELELEENTKRNSVSSLFSTREKLHTDKGSTNVNNSINTDINHIAIGSIQLAPKGASDLLTKQLKSDVKTSKISRESSEATYVHDEESIYGGKSQKAIEFYQKQVLLLKNEIEFLNYVKRMSKLNCLELKRHIHQIMRESASKTHSSDNISELAYNDLLATMKELRLETTEELDLKNEELAQLNARVEELKRMLEDMQQRYTVSEASLSTSRQIILKIELDGAARDTELKDFKSKAKLAEIEGQGDGLIETRENNEMDPSPERIYPEEQSRKMFDMEIEMNSLKESNKRLAAELERSEDLVAYSTQSHEKRIEALKHDLGEQLRKSVDVYEQKIRELNLVIVRFEALLEEKNAHIIQLSTSRPIRIPSISDPENSDKNVFRSDNSGSNPTLDYFSRLPTTPPVPNAQKPSLPGSRQASTQSFPIIKGRGGYQKRIKKIM